MMKNISHTKTPNRKLLLIGEQVRRLSLRDLSEVIGAGHSVRCTQSQDNPCTIP